RPQSFVSKYESGERRLDILELYDVCGAIGVTLNDFVKQLQVNLTNDKN
ncbi:MAG TPA: transcriptional regulator, partial [Gimesia maris]|nr:transcriptional regulator [Gimesia maris]